MDVANKIKLQLVEQELALLHNAIYMIEIRIRVAKKVGNDSKAYEEELVKLMMMEGELQAIIGELS
jgi:hypothetical protein